MYSSLEEFEGRYDTLSRPVPRTDCLSSFIACISANVSRPLSNSSHIKRTSSLGSEGGLERNT